MAFSVAFEEISRRWDTTLLRHYTPSVRPCERARRQENKHEKKLDNVKPA